MVPGWFHAVTNAKLMLWMTSVDAQCGVTHNIDASDELLLVYFYFSVPPKLHSGYSE
jgi:hypothetical protein